MSVIDSALAQVKQLHPYTPGKPVEELERELGISNAIKLASNENPLGCSQLVQRAIKRASSHIELYPDANAFYLKRALAERLAVDAGQITIGNGSNDVLDLLARTFLDSSAEAIYSEHAFLVYALVVQACGAKARVAPALPEDAEQAYGHDLSAMLALISENTRVIFIANPNNPTGTWLKRTELKDFIDAVPGHIAVIVDEAYFEYVDENDYPDALQWLGEFPNLIVTRTFSKIYGLAGLRVGYAISSAEVNDLLNRLRQPFNANTLALAAAIASLADQEFVKASLGNNQKGLRQLADYFDSKNISYIPSVANFLSVKFGRQSEDIYANLLQQGIIVRPLGNYNLPEYLRITIGTEQQLASLMEKLDGLL
ncbi:MAG: histidinol-phosphate transaminase [Gammaproteobacteria bacterium]|nr:histidinol-phosphate transaminase [Gammaproteobacteria bacterium]